MGRRKKKEGNLAVGKRVLRSDAAKQREKEVPEEIYPALDVENDDMVSVSELKLGNKMSLRSSTDNDIKLRKTQVGKFSKKLKKNGEEKSNAATKAEFDDTHMEIGKTEKSNCNTVEKIVSIVENRRLTRSGMTKIRQEVNTNMDENSSGGTSRAKKKVGKKTVAAERKKKVDVNKKRKMIVESDVGKDGSSIREQNKQIKGSKRVHGSSLEETKLKNGKRTNSYLYGCSFKGEELWKSQIGKFTKKMKKNGEEKSNAVTIAEFDDTHMEISNTEISKRNVVKKKVVSIVENGRLTRSSATKKKEVANTNADENGSSCDETRSFGKFKARKKGGKKTVVAEKKKVNVDEKREKLESDVGETSCIKKRMKFNSSLSKQSKQIKGSKRIHGSSSEEAIVKSGKRTSSGLDACSFEGEEVEWGKLLGPTIMKKLKESNGSKESLDKDVLKITRKIVRDHIKRMLIDAGWKFDFRIRKGGKSLDTVYLGPNKESLWSIVKAYYAHHRNSKEYAVEKCITQKSEIKSCQPTFQPFVPIPEAVINILKHPISRRRTVKELEAAGFFQNGKLVETNMENDLIRHKRKRGRKPRSVVEEHMKNNFTEEKCKRGRKPGSMMKKPMTNNFTKEIGKRGGKLGSVVETHMMDSFTKEEVKRGRKSENVVKKYMKNNFTKENSERRRKPGRLMNQHMKSNLSIENCKTGRKPGVLSRKSHMVKYKRKQKGNALLVRGLNRDETYMNSYEPYTGKRTTLAWLIDLGVVLENAEVRYTDPRHTKTLLKGIITRDGIDCSCCSTLCTVSEFEIHAGSELCKPYENTVLDDGRTLMQCQINAWEKQTESERKDFLVINITSDDENDDTCGVCGDGGDLICCDGCPSTFHQSCLGTEMPPGDWYCMNCTCRYCASNSDIVVQEYDEINSQLLTCSQCDEKYHQKCVPPEEVCIKSIESTISFCKQSCKKIFENLRKLIGVERILDEGYLVTVVQRFDKDLVDSAFTLEQWAQCNSKIAVALSVMDECFLPIIDHRSGINLIHNVVYNCGSNFSRLNFRGFYTFILERNDEIYAVASIRVHGTKVAEMPFIGTRNMYRRQGMCRRLLNEIESVLSSLNIKKLIIPAISQLRDTWMNSFNFKPLDISDEEEVRSLNLVVFPGTGLLQKTLVKKFSDDGNQVESEMIIDSVEHTFDTLHQNEETRISCTLIEDQVDG